MNTQGQYRFIIGVLVILALGMGVWTRAREETERQKSFTVSGVVKAVDLDQAIVTVTIRSTTQRALAWLRGKDQMFSVLENARIATRGRPRAKLKDIARGDRVTMHGRYRGEPFVVDRIVAGNTRYLQKVKRLPARGP